MKPSSATSSERLRKRKQEAPVDDGDEVTKKKKRTPAITAEPEAAPKGKAKVKPEPEGGDAKKKPKKGVDVTELKRKAIAEKTDLSVDMASIEEDLKQQKKQPLTDNTWVDTYESMFKKLRRIMRTMETKVLDSNGNSNDIYALMALYNQMREIIADIRSMIDLSQNTQRIIDKILYPLIRDISNNYVDAIFLINKNLRANVDNNKYIELKAATDECLKEHAKYIQAAYEKSSEQLAKLLEE